MTDHVSEFPKSPERVSLREASRRAPKIIQRGDSLLLDEGAAPTLNDLAEALQFALGDGRIWFNDNRMVLMQTDVLGSLMAQMIRDKGIDHTRAQAMRVGWDEGVKLAQIIRSRFEQQDLTAMLAAGPRLHTIEGYAKVTTRRFEFDAEQKTYHGEFHWTDSVMGTQYLRRFGVCDCPACWLQVGVPSGYTTTLLGFPVIFREIECVAQGAARCIVVGKDVAGWGDDVPELEMFGLTKPDRRRAAPWNPASAVSNLGEAGAGPTEGVIIGTSPPMSRAKRLLDKAAPFSEPVLLLGEPGTGKTFFARHLHKLGSTSEGPFVSVNCAALADTAAGAEDELLGKGGFLDQAKGGTLFLNSVLSLGTSHQAKLASLLDEAPRRLRDTRIICSTGQNPVEAIRSGAFRSDLHTRLSVLPIEVPALRERRDDIPMLIKHFLSVQFKRLRKPVQGLSGAAFDALLRYDYPGNVRELSNLIGRGMVFAEEGGFIEINHMFSSLETLPEIVKTMKPALGNPANRAVAGPGDGAGDGAQSMMESLEIELLRTTLNETGWNVSEAARKLRVTRAKVDYRIKKFGLIPPG